MTNYHYLDKSKTDYLTYSRFDLLIFLSMCSRLIKEAMQNVVYVREGKIEKQQCKQCTRCSGEPEDANNEKIVSFRDSGKGTLRVGTCTSHSEIPGTQRVKSNRK
ncbi:hypothetical protein J6590_107109 [Homalodisca vitripennis]|nr:hypothetical protein J6590_107109 [Homalodisca vitripennis]